MQKMNLKPLANDKSRARRWTFTLNNYSMDDIRRVEQRRCQYLVCGFEVGLNGTPHMQGYVEFKETVMLQTMKNWLPKAHFEKALGSALQNLTYCTKEKENAKLPPIIKGEPINLLGGRGGKNHLLNYFSFMEDDYCQNTCNCFRCKS